MDNYVTPRCLIKRFTCPHCGALAGISWDHTFINKDDQVYKYHRNAQWAYTNTIYISSCHACGNFHIWLDDELIYPIVSNIPSANIDMPDNVLKIYNEAKAVFPFSAKASAALLRLAIQMLCKELGETGENINDDISKMVQKGLPLRVQQALDFIRVVGNNAVHPGTIDLEDNREIAGSMFVLINIIVNDMITQPNSISRLYTQLPQGSLDAIKRRDGNNT
ncbi:DUF4145 domain-containing protein [Anaerocolumna jejuensis]|uniref:DUF4145 domain-containing protein n=1 Tax=Anaerocolumna jejuensis TaxID=259063 RepID=UPI003F7C1E39